MDDFFLNFTAIKHLIEQFSIEVNVVRKRQ